MFSLYWEKEIPQKIDKLIEILEKMKEHQLIVTDSLVGWICAKYPELKGTDGVCEKNINKLYMNCVELKEYIFLVGNEKESPLFQFSIGRIIDPSKDKYTEQTSRSLSDINAASFVQEYLGITNYDSLKSASTGQKKKRRTKNRSTGGEEKTVWDKMITTGLLILEKTGLILQRIFATTPFTEKTRIGQIISSIWLICTIALTLYFPATVSSFTHPIVLFSLTIYSYFKIFECTIIGIAGMKLAISKLNFFRCAKEVSVPSDSFQNNSLATKHDKFQLFHDYRTWQEHITYEQIQKQEQDECREVLSEHSRTTFSATS